MTGEVLPAGLPGYRLVTAIVAADDADRLVAWCARTELPADIRETIGNLGQMIGWTQQQVMLGGMLVQAVAILEAAEHQPKEET